MKIELDLTHEEFDEVVTAIRRREPRTPTHQYSTCIMWSHCPTCGSLLMETKQPYCSHCGQAIDWREE